jgi:hypothetical protein
MGDPKAKQMARLRVRLALILVNLDFGSGMWDAPTLAYDRGAGVVAATQEEKPGLLSRGFRLRKI